MWPSGPAAIGTTSAIVSRQGSSLEWCSYGPTRTTGRSPAGMAAVRAYRSARASGSRSPRIATSLLIAAVAPEPQNSTTSSGPAPTLPAMIRRASSRRAPVCRPVAEASVWVLA
ncbi:hypothetical protein GCM10020358_69450 [Amorphoplanes nipponensis]